MEGLQFLPQKENLVFLGSVGTGKIHLARAIALKACQAGRWVRFFTAASLANLLLERNNKGTLNGFLENLRRVELIVVDEIERLSQNLCKPPMRCRIGAPHWRF